MQMKRSLHDNLEVGVSVAPGAKTDGTVTGATVDLTDADALQFLIHVAAWTDGTHELQFFHRWEDTDAWTRVPTDELDAKVAADLGDDAGDGRVVVDDASHDGSVIQVGYIGGRGEARVDLVTTGSTTGATIGALHELGRLRHVGVNPQDDPTFDDPSITA